MNERLWPRKLAWLAFLVPFFFLTYNFANDAASRRAHVAVLMFPWERHIPFLAWTIFPYWSSDLLYVLSLWICRTREELHLHGKRLMAIQIFSVACFLVFPLRCGFRQPVATGYAGDLFGALHLFDKPFNQAPSLHVGLAVVLWIRFRAHIAGLGRVLLAGWMLLVCASTLTTYQHQFIDLPTGAWAGLLVLAALPDRRVAETQFRLTLSYLAGSIICTAAAFTLGGIGWLLLWPGFALSMVAAAYWTGDPAWLGKRMRAASLLMLPYTVSAWINSRLWTRGEPAKSHLIDKVWIGRAPSAHDREGINSVVGLAPELPIRGDAHVAMLDLAPPTVDQLDAAVQAITGLAAHRPTLVCCALGYSRTAIAAAAWLIAAGYAADTDDALAQVRRARPQVIVSAKYKQRLQQWAAQWGDQRNQHGA